MIHDTGGHERPPEPGIEYYLGMLSELEDRSALLMSFSRDSIRRLVLIDGGAERGWYGAIVYDIDKDESTFIVGNASDRDEPLFEFPKAESTLDFEKAVESMAETEKARSEAAVEAFIEAIDDVANPN